jgi:hypothetical protein
VGVYFRILHKKILETKGDFKSDVRKLEPIFRSFKLNTRILRITDIVVTKFLEDTAVDDEIELANTQENNKVMHTRVEHPPPRCVSREQRACIEDTHLED